ncbi:MAG TPA: dihydrofolate reductase family protein [Dehalococcoidia bacterium]|nr:dihydrofolate reductase family protein [Dehalococcoidia bacterium]
MLIRTHIGVSLDGLMATADGSPIWNSMPTFVPGHSHGYPEFIEGCEAVVVGRTSFDFGHAYWTEQGGWPWPNLRVYVLTSRPLPERRHADVVAVPGGPAGLLKQLRGGSVNGDVQLLGGPRVIQGFLDLGAVDRLGLVILPILAGAGVHLFASGGVTRSLRLERQRAFPDGAVQLVYAQA